MESNRAEIEETDSLEGHPIEASESQPRNCETMNVLIVRTDPCFHTSLHQTHRLKERIHAMDLSAEDLLQISLDRVLSIKDDEKSLHDPEAIAQHLPAIEQDAKLLNGEVIQPEPILPSMSESHQELLNDSIVEGRPLIRSSIHRLPSELLSSIFAFVCGDVSGCRLAARIPALQGECVKHPEYPPAPVLLSMVCASWRENALSTSSLWSSMTIVPPPTLHDAAQLGKEGESEGERLHRMTKMFVARAHNTPLTIRFECGSYFAFPGNPFTAAFSRAIDVLCAHSCQWFDVDFDSLVSHIFPVIDVLPALRNIRGNLPHLRRIAGYSATISLLGHIFDCSCPALRSIDIKYLEGQEERLLDIIPWGQIEDLVFANPEPSPLDLVSLCPKLKSLDLSQRLQDWRHIPYHDHQLTSNLESLTLTLAYEPSDAWSIWAPLLGHITLPRLSSLTLYHIHQTINNASPLLQCITRSKCAITSLVLTCDMLSLKDSRHLLSLTPWLTTLALHEKPGHGNPLDRMRDFLGLLYVKQSTVGPDSATPTTVEGETVHVLTRLQHVSLGLSNPLYASMFGSDSDSDSDSEDEGEGENRDDPFRSFFDSNRDADDMTVYKVVASRWLPDRREAVRVGVVCLRSVTIRLTLESGPGGLTSCDLPDLERLRELGEEGLEVFIVL
ncbi:hypothetical protein PM082_022401 [Marasmius tenuissimus]|nr:hypothetical protein PM082_022401 [Marasmius tenuissimus]